MQNTPSFNYNYGAMGQMQPSQQTAPNPPAQAPKNDGKIEVGAKEVMGIVAATAITTAAVAGIVFRRRATLDSTTQERLAEALRQNEALQKAQQQLQGMFDDIQAKCNDLTTKNASLQSDLSAAKSKLAGAYDTGVGAAGKRESIYQTLKLKVLNRDLGYNPVEPPITGKGTRVFENAVDLPPRVPTSNRSFIRRLNIPEVGSDGSFSFTLPTSNEMKVVRATSKDFQPVLNRPTTISASYADSVQWSNDKIARDVLQNFFDGHGQTLDGVRITSTPTAGGKYRIRIEGQSTYTADKALYIGESTKKTDAKAAGNYGEGLKMAALKLLKDGGASDVRIASDNWNLTYRLANDSLSDKQVLSYSLDKAAQKFEGNFVEFETADLDLVQTFRNSINRFYHSGNEHFKCPDFENAILGIKKVQPGEKGGLYISGQRFEFDNDFDGLKDLVVFIKEKPPVSVLDPSRDRTSLNTSQLESIAKWFTSDTRTTEEDKIQIINTLEPYWRKDFGNDRNPVKKFFDSILWDVNFNNRYRADNPGLYKNAGPIYLKFPDKYVAFSNASPELVQELESSGYVVCDDKFGELGMKTIRELMGDARAHKPFEPNATEKQKISIIKEALSKFTSLEGSEFTPEELATKIYLFDAKAGNENAVTSNALAEAIVDARQSKGFWMDREYLGRASFGDALETALHELSHKAGGDESMEFSYKLTYVNSKVYQQLFNDPEVRTQLETLNRLWDEVVSAAGQAGAAVA